MEPMLSGREETIRTFHRLQPWVTETIWIGKLNRKAVFGNERVKMEGRQLRELQSDDDILKLVSELGGEPKVRWKDSIHEVLRKHVAAEVGDNKRE